MQIGLVIGSWGIISSMVAIIAGSGEDNEMSANVTMGTTYGMMLLLLSTLILLGAYVSASFGDNPIEAIFCAIGSTTLGCFLALFIGNTIMENEIDGEFLKTTQHLLNPLILTVITAIVGSLFRIFSTNYNRGLLEEFIEQPSISDDSEIINTNEIQFHSLSTTVSNLDNRIQMIETVLHGTRFNELLYGQR